MIPSLPALVSDPTCDEPVIGPGQVVPFLPRRMSAQEAAAEFFAAQTKRRNKGARNAKSEKYSPVMRNMFPRVFDISSSAC